MIFFFFLALVENENKCAHEDFGRSHSARLYRCVRKETKQNWKGGNRFLYASDTNSRTNCTHLLVATEVHVGDFEVAVAGGRLQHNTITALEGFSTARSHKLIVGMVPLR